ncbi:MAG: hypothetical protein HUJ28_02140 [Chromatiales bacterium]|nr:hypothetical protein [Chromatiales bacterium]
MCRRYFPGRQRIVPSGNSNDARPDEPHTLVVDQGTHASRALIFDARGVCLHENHLPVSLSRTDGHIEQDAEALLASVQQVIEVALNQGHEDIGQMALATQRSTVVAWDARDGRPLAPAISWQDRRNADWLAAHAPPADELARITGLRASPHYGASKLRWWLDHAPQIRDAAAGGHLCLGPLAAFLVARLVPESPPAVDVTNAARTLLLDIDRGDWDDSLLAHFGIERQWLPQVRPVRADYGRLAGTGIPLTAVSGDQTAALFVDGLPPQEALHVNLGSGAFVLAVTGRDRHQVPGLLAGLADHGPEGPLYYAEGTVNGAGSALDWLAREGDQPLPPERIRQALAASDHEPPLFLNGVGGLGSPWWGTTRPRFIEETPASPAARITAVVESIAFLVVENIERLREAGLRAARLVFTGGLSGLDRLCQDIVDLAGLPGERLDQPEATARGAAWLAAKDHASWIPTPRTPFMPRPATALRRRRQRFRQALTASLAT